MKVRFQADADLNQFIPQHLPIASVVEDLVLIWLVTEAGEWENQICFLPL